VSSDGGETGQENWRGKNRELLSGSAVWRRHSMTTHCPPTGMRLLQPPTAPVPPSPAHEFPSLRSDIVSWGCGGESVDDLLALAEAHARRLPDWGANGGDEGWVRKVVHRWLFDHLFSRKRDHFVALVQAAYKHLKKDNVVDVVDAALEKAWTRWESAARDPGSEPLRDPIAVLMHMAGFAYRDRSSVKRRTYAQRNGVVSLAAFSDGGFDVPDRGPQPDEAAEFAERVSLLLGRLSADEQHLFHLKFVEWLKPAEIAIRLNVTPDAAQQRVTRLRHKLVEKLGPHVN
jgi:RNA polymerase sigma factor (sigma-70 family)